VRLAVSSVDPAYAVAELDSKTAVLHRIRSSWRVAGFGPSLSCAVAPRNVLSDLAVSCAPEGLAISDCGKLVERPLDLTLTCADANYRLTGLVWASWGRGAARGAGSVSANDCAPTCVAGRFHTYRVTVEASRPQACPKGRRYTVLTIRYAGSRPKGIGETDVHTFTCAY
jgi:hypothetical protein